MKNSKCINCGVTTKGYTQMCHTCSFKKGGKTKGENSVCWKGDNVGYTALHYWVKKNKPQKNYCERCGKTKVWLDLANKGIYNRDFENWEELCRKCHMISDGRIKQLAKQSSYAGNQRIKKNNKRDAKGKFI